MWCSWMFVDADCDISFLFDQFITETLSVCCSQRINTWMQLLFYKRLNYQTSPLPSYQERNWNRQARNTLKSYWNSSMNWQRRVKAEEDWFSLKTQERRVLRRNQWLKMKKKARLTTMKTTMIGILPRILSAPCMTTPAWSGWDWCDRVWAGRRMMTPMKKESARVKNRREPNPPPLDRELRDCQSNTLAPCFQYLSTSVFGCGATWCSSSGSPCPTSGFHQLEE